MGTKLTLNVDRTIADRAKEYAKSRGRSLSSLVEDYFRLITKAPDADEIEISPKVKSLLGSIKVPEGFDYKKELTDRISEKYSKK